MSILYTSIQHYAGGLSQGSEMKTEWEVNGLERNETFTIHIWYVCTRARSVPKLCLTPCNPRDCSLPGSSIHGTFQARILEWVAISSPGDLPDPGIEPKSPSLQADALMSAPPGRPWWEQWKVKVKLLSHVWLFATPGTVACQAPLSMGFSRQEYQSGLPFPTPGDLPDPGIKCSSVHWQADSLPLVPRGKPYMYDKGQY